MASILVKLMVNVAWKLLPMARNNIMASMRLCGFEIWRVIIVSTFCEIFYDLHGLMALNRHSGPPTAP